jgi:hypothetical protein
VGVEIMDGHRGDLHDITNIEEVKPFTLVEVT